MGLDLMTTIEQYLRAIGWTISASIGFAVGVAIALWIFDIISRDIDEWEEIKNGNIGVSLIFVSLIVMIGLIVIKVI
jgi:uncharacterized membrane protein YjfL (UPF0719 family)|tara:strand:+ start:412 stop:642 length:231 start_codon:yes stop_codon:yes gene_type:complete